MRKDRIKELEDKIIARSIACDRVAILAHNAINHRRCCNKYPDVARYWAERR